MGSVPRECFLLDTDDVSDLEMMQSVTPSPNPIPLCGYWSDPVSCLVVLFAVYLSPDVIMIPIFTYYCGDSHQTLRGEVFLHKLGKDVLNIM